MKRSNSLSALARSLLKAVLAILFIFGGAQHLMNPDFYIPFVPSFFPLTLAVVYISGFLEIILGLALLFKKYATLGAWGIIILMLLFLPIHIWDVFSETPAVGSHKAALVRLPIQCLLIVIAWKVKKNVSQG